jgi:RNA polymerase sigma factor (sigma-70 family)
MPGGEGSITLCLGGLREGDEAAVRALLDRYRDPLEAYARRLLRALGASRAVADEQDLAQEAMATVIDGIRKQKYKDLRDREALIRLLWIVTRRRALKMKRYQAAGRRTERAATSMVSTAVAALDGADASAAPDAGRGDGGGPTPDPAGELRWECRTKEVIAHVAGRERDPEEVVGTREEVRAMLEILDDERDRHLLLLKLEGYTHAEIAERLDCSKRAISLRFQRVCATIRKLAP